MRMCSKSLISLANLTWRPFNVIMLVQSEEKDMAATVREVNMIDVNGGEIQIVFSADRTRMWVNIDGTCRLRVYAIEKLDMDQGFEDIIKERSHG